MANKRRKFADDGWAVWVDGENVSTVYINDWINPKGKSYVDLAVRVRGAKAGKLLRVYVPFPVACGEIEDVSLRFDDTRILQATFSTACIIDYKKNEHTSEVAYNGKTVDIVHISTLDYKAEELAKGTLICVDMEKLQPFLDNDEVYFIWRMPHKSLDEIFTPQVNVKSVIERMRELLITPVISERYSYSVRINEARLVPEEISRIGTFHRQKLKKAVITLSLAEEYELNDAGCYRIRRLEENLYEDYLPADYLGSDIITYQWNQGRETNFQGQFNFYYNIARNSISKGSMFLYVLLLLVVGVVGNGLFNALVALRDLLF